MITSTLKKIKTQPKLKILINDDRCEKAFLVGLFLEENGHSVVMPASKLSPDFLNEGYFDLEPIPKPVTHCSLASGNY